MSGTKHAPIEKAAIRFKCKLRCECGEDHESIVIQRDEKWLFAGFTDPEIEAARTKGDTDGQGTAEKQPEAE